MPSRRSLSRMGIRKANVLPVPVCAVASTSLPCRPGGIASACTGVGFTKPAHASCPFREGLITNSEKSSILLSCWHTESCTHIHMLFSGGTASFNYAENVRRKLRAGILRSITPTRGAAQHNRGNKRTHTLPHFTSESTNFFRTAYTRTHKCVIIVVAAFVAFRHLSFPGGLLSPTCDCL